MTRRPRLLALVVLVALMGVSCRYSSDLHLPDDQAVSSRILWGDGSLLTRVHGVEDRDPVTLAEMAPTLPRAVIAIEDAHFYEHGGFEVRGILRALRNDIEQGRAAEGGSTITQQYVRAVMLGSEKSLKRKLHEAVMAVQLEDRYSKKTILERYLNTVYFGNGAYGVQAAARTYFGKDAKDLDLAQSALLAGVIRSPEDYDPYRHPDAALARRNEVLARMLDLHRITGPESILYTAAPLGVAPLVDEQRYRAPFFVEKVKQFILGDDHFGATRSDRQRKLFQGGLTIETTLDPTWQTEAETALHGVLTDPGDPPGALVATDPQTGQVKAYASSQDFWGPLPYAKFDLADARDENGNPTRQPGSSFKPFVLATALEHGIPLTKTYQGNSPREVGDGPPLHNFQDEQFGRIDLTEATVHSVNTVYGQLALDAGLGSIADQAMRMGITSHLIPIRNIAIGDEAVTVEDMAGAYGAFPADGIRHPQVFVTKVTDPKGHVLYQDRSVPTRVLSERNARLVNGVLAQVVGRGTGVNARIGRPAAGKTGTTDDEKNAWFVGYTPQLVAAVWVGFPDSTPMRPPRTRRDGQGGIWPAQIWQVFASSALANVPSVDFAEPGPLEPPSNPSATTTTRPAVPGIISVVGIDAITATRSLTEKGFRVVNVAQPSRKYPPGYVIAQDPVAGTPLRPGSTITLTVANGRPRVLTVPNVLGQIADQAAATIRAAGFEANVVVEVQPAPVPPDSNGNAWQQSPVSGTRADEGTTVTVWVNP